MARFWIYRPWAFFADGQNLVSMRVQSRKPRLHETRQMLYQALYVPGTMRSIRLPVHTNISPTTLVYLVYLDWLSNSPL